MIKIRKYRKGEEDVLRQICRDTTRHVNVLEYGSVLVEKWVARLADSVQWRQRLQQHNPLIAENDGEIVGFAELDPTGRINAFYSHHQWQQRGVGSALLEAIEIEAKTAGITCITVVSSIGASKFFEHRGFRAVEERQSLTGGTSSKSLLLIKHNGDKTGSTPIDNYWFKDSGHGT